MHWRRKWQPTPVFLPGESQGRGSQGAAVYGVAQSRTRLKQRSSKEAKGWFSSLEAEFSEEQRPLGEASREGPGKEVFLTLIAQLLSLSRADLRLRVLIKQKESVSLLLIIQASLRTQLVNNPPSMQET